MSDLVAKPIVKNKFWVVEDHGNKIATIQATDDGKYVYVHDDKREPFPSIKVLSKRYNISFGKPEKKKVIKNNTVYGYPIRGKAYNELYDVSRKLPVYTKTEKSKSFFCAGYYLVKFENQWTAAYCPKLITLSRYSYQGPYFTEDDMQQQLRKNNG